MNNNYAYVTLVASDNYIYGALGLAYSLQKMHCKYPLLILITNNCSPKVRELCEQFNILYKIVPLLTFPYQHPVQRYNVTRSKIYITSLIDYKKICYLDADTILLKNLDRLLENPKISNFMAYRVDDGKDHNILVDGAFIILTPNIDFFHQIMGISNFYSEDECTWTYFFPYNPSQSIFDDKLENNLYYHFRDNKYWEELNCDWSKIENFLQSFYKKYNINL